MIAISGSDEKIRYEIKSDRLHTAAIERGATLTSPIHIPTMDNAQNANFPADFHATELFLFRWLFCDKSLITCLALCIQGQQLNCIKETGLRESLFALP